MQKMDEPGLSLRAPLTRSRFLVMATAAVGAVLIRPSYSLGKSELASPTWMSLTDDESLRRRFNFLSQQTSNQCNLQASTLNSYPPTARLQGSCCSPMVYESYVRQVRALAAYDDPDIPRDPYDVSVPLAKRLIAYNEQILLTNSQRQIYNTAIRMADEGGPCCCHCWRWTAFEGQAKKLIVRRSYTASRLAELWNAQDGCGGGGGSGEGHAGHDNNRPG